MTYNTLGGNRMIRYATFEEPNCDFPNKQNCLEVPRTLLSLYGFLHCFQLFIAFLNFTRTNGFLPQNTGIEVKVTRIKKSSSVWSRSHKRIYRRRTWTQLLVHNAFTKKQTEEKKEGMSFVHRDGPASTLLTAAFRNICEHENRVFRNGADCAVFST